MTGQAYRAQKKRGVNKTTNFFEGSISSSHTANGNIKHSDLLPRNTMSMERKKNRNNYRPLWGWIYDGQLTFWKPKIVSRQRMRAGLSPVPHPDLLRCLFSFKGARAASPLDGFVSYLGGWTRACPVVGLRAVNKRAAVGKTPTLSFVSFPGIPVGLVCDYAKSSVFI